ncbi:response regulator [Pseudomonas sp. ArH3a]|uniref:ATP-binding protein n=1 Tax=Pseudomonas sp. ArH3a TaxID=2862945 RepID=UPI001F5972BE|nr:ATP-binding protein [Pseudomonas sp. ArH3a]UNM20053.1 response regulator [Pseudomonas sp. ArH3a]
MQKNNHSRLIINSFFGIQIPVVLLRLFIFSLLLCILIIAGFIIYWALDETLSHNRRQMNAAAFNAQQLFIQRESLLNSITYSAVRNIDDTVTSATPEYLDGNNQLRTFPLSNNDEHYRWALILTERDLAEIGNTGAHLIYLSLNGGGSRALHGAGSICHAKTQSAAQRERLKGLERSLAQQLLEQPPVDRAFWAWVPNGSLKQVYLLRSIEQNGPKQDWLGLELSELGLILEPQQMHEGKFVLYDADGDVVLHSSSWDFPSSLARLQAAEDSFGLHWQGGLPDYIMLNKSVGNAGWRLVYYAPVTQLLQDTSFVIYATALVTLLLFALILFGARYIRLRLVEPAARHYSALADSVSLNQLFIEVAPVGLCLIRCDDGSLILSNTLAKRFLASLPELRETILQDIPEHSHSVEYQLPDGTFIQLTRAPTTYNDAAALLCCMNDVTEFKLAEQSLLQAKDLSDQSNREKTLFLSTLSHEIRTPMYGILGSLEMLRSAELSAEQVYYLEATQQASSVLMQTIDDTLEMSLIESGRLRLSIAPFSPVRLVEEVASSYSARARSKGLLLYVTLDPLTPEAVIGDGGRIRQILNNLVSNAIKFTDSGHVILRLYYVQGHEQKAQLRFQVVDSGPGIAPELHANLFKPYYRAPGWLSQNTSGTGLGLSICERLSFMMNGHLSTTSEPGLGSSFSLSLALELSDPTPSPQMPTLDVTPVYVRGDVPEVVQNLCQWLRQWGAQAFPYTTADNNSLPSRKSVLVEAFLGTLRPITWNGPRVIMHAPGMGPSPMVSNSWIARSFSFNNLREVVAQAQSGIASEMRLAPSVRRASTLQLKLLAVDDSPLALQVIDQQCTYLGNQIVTSSSAVDALKRADLLTFDAILTDVQMEDMNGLAFARNLREHGFEGPIIGITGELSSTLRNHCKLEGIRHLLIKPVPLDALYEVLQSVQGKVI